MPETAKKPRTTKPAATHRAAKAVRAAKEHKAPAPKAHGKYFEAVGRRKTATARVRLFEGSGKLTINGREGKKYLPLSRLVADAVAPLTNLKIEGEWDITAKVMGGGTHAQAGAIRLGVARAIVKKNAEWKKRLRVLGFLTRDSRMVERKKYGLKKARRRPQWAKR